MGCYNCRNEKAVYVSIANTLYGVCSDKQCRALLHEKLDEHITELLKQRAERERMKRKGFVVK
jgi:hypothetical protein